jgi:hypothetical protein
MDLVLSNIFPHSDLDWFGGGVCVCVWVGWVGGVGWGGWEGTNI